MRARENRSDVDVELELEDPTEDEGGWVVVVTLVEHHEPTAVSAGGGWGAKRRGDVPTPRKRTMSSEAIGEREAKRMRSSCSSEASPALSPPTPGMVG